MSTSESSEQEYYDAISRNPASTTSENSRSISGQEGKLFNTQRTADDSQLTYIQRGVEENNAVSVEVLAQNNRIGEMVDSTNQGIERILVGMTKGFKELNNAMEETKKEAVNQGEATRQHTTEKIDESNARNLEDNEKTRQLATSLNVETIEKVVEINKNNREHYARLLDENYNRLRDTVIEESKIIRQHNSKLSAESNKITIEEGDKTRQAFLSTSRSITRMLLCFVLGMLAVQSFFFAKYANGLTLLLLACLFYFIPDFCIDSIYYVFVSALPAEKSMKAKTT